LQDYLSGLNAAQKEAVLKTTGPVLILAGAGSGKTKTITHKIAYLIDQKLTLPYQILAVTFTNKAANEMKDRLANLLHWSEHSSPLIWLGTFHAICLKLLRREASVMGLKSDFSVYDERDSISVIKSILREMGYSDKEYNPSAIKSLISAAKNEYLSPSAYAQLSYGPMQKMAAQVYVRYQQELKKSMALDFDDLLFYSLSLLDQHEDILEKYRNLWKYCFVDEYQDTNQVQYDLIKKLAIPNICVVGDDWQSIYSWRGANFRNILNFEKDYPDTLTVKLEQNYRSSQNILDSAQAVMAKSDNRSDKKLWTDAGSGVRVGLINAVSDIDEIQRIIRMIDNATIDRYKLSDIAILYRTNSQSRIIEEYLLSNNIAYKIVGGLRFYDRAEIKDLIAYLKIIINPRDFQSIIRVAGTPPKGLGDKSLQALKDFMNSHDYDLLEASSAIDSSNLNPRAKKAVVELANFIERFLPRAQEVGNLVLLIRDILNASGLIHYYQQEKEFGPGRVENMEEFISVAANAGDKKLSDFLLDLSLSSDLDKINPDMGALSLLTMHAAKGLEYDMVFIVGLEEGILPHNNSLLDQEQIEEERRLLYVGMTRARKRLILSFAQKRMLYGNITISSISRFLSDIPQNLLESM
jgi:DNA helicase-2/ATP-dependent DNA helicase PcrA